MSAPTPVPATDKVLTDHPRIRRHLEARTALAADHAPRLDPPDTLGARMADRIASIGGSWGFLGCFAVVLVGWVGLNGLILTGAMRFDPYPFVFLNLILSMLAAVQAPVIMMSQNRQAMKDRLAAQHDFEINLKAELEILSLHRKLDALKADHAHQFAQLRALLVAEGVRDPDGTTR